MDERRKHVRVPACLTIRVNVSGFEHFGVIRNVSKGGILLICGSKFVEETVVTMVLSAPDEPLFRLTGKVVWCKPEPADEGTGHLHGIQFTGKTDEFERYVEKLLEAVDSGKCQEN